MKLFLKSIGVSDDIVEHLDNVHLAFQRPAILWVGLLLLVPAGVFIYRRQRHNLSTVPQKFHIALTTTRTIVLLMLVIVLAGPYLKLDHRIDRKPIFAVMFDRSQSMQLTAGPFESDDQLGQIAAAAGLAQSESAVGAETRKAMNSIGRAELAARLVRHAATTLLEPVGEAYDLRYYTFNRSCTPLPFDLTASEPLTEDAVGGSASCIGDAILHILEESAGRPVAGMLLLTDGQNTGGSSPAQAARAAAVAKAPLFVVPLGSIQPVQDVALVDVYTSGLVAVGDTVQVHATLASQGFDGRTVTIELKDGNELLDSQEVRVSDAEQRQVVLTFEAKRAGSHYLAVNLPNLPEEDEALLANNTDTAFVRVSDDKLRILIIDGSPRWDFRFLKNAVRRDTGLTGRVGELPDVVVETEWRRMDFDEQLTALPRTPEAFAEYHTIVLGDVSRELLNDDLREMLAAAVRDKGVGLLVAAGTQTMPHQYGSTIQDLLPVKLDMTRSGNEAPVYNPYRLELTSDGEIHETMRLYDDPGRNRKVWAEIPPFYWCAAVDRPAAGATVLAWNASVETRYGKMPLIAYHYAGEGKVMFVGTDSTWLWRENVGDRYFYKFWGQALRFLARSDVATGRNSWIEVRPVRAQPGEEAAIELMAFKEDGSPEVARVRVVTIHSPDGPEPIEVIADNAKPGRYTGRFTPESVGVHRLTYQPEGSDTVEAKIRVLIAPEELRHPNVNRKILDFLASASGGRVTGLSELGTIPEQLTGENDQQQLHHEATVWDNWLILVILVLTYAIDVGIRRIMGLP